MWKLFVTRCVTKVSTTTQCTNYLSKDKYGRWLSVACFKRLTNCACFDSCSFKSLAFTQFFFWNAHPDATQHTESIYILIKARKWNGINNFIGKCSFNALLCDDWTFNQPDDVCTKLFVYLPYLIAAHRLQSFGFWKQVRLKWSLYIASETKMKNKKHILQ